MKKHTLRCDNEPYAIFANVDMAEEMDSIDAGIVDVIVTSPPYNIGTKYEGFEDSLSWPEYHDQFISWMSDLCYVLKPEGSIFFNLASSSSHQDYLFSLIDALPTYLKIQNVIHWIKSISIGNISHGHYKPINSERYLNNTHEYIFHLTKSGNVPLDRTVIGVPYMDKTNIKRWKGKTDKRCRGNVWFIPYDTVQSKKEHPATFPVTLPLWAIQLHGVEKTKLVLDPFMGTGTTAIAALSLGCKFIGFEISPTYYKQAVERVSEWMDKQKET